MERLLDRRGRHRKLHGTVDGFNSFNYVKDGPVSEIYGQLNAIGGNIFIANPAASR